MNATAFGRFYDAAIKNFSVVVAPAGAATGTATLMTGWINVAKGASVDGTKGVRLPPSVVIPRVVVNYGSSALPVYPPTGGTINAGGTNVAYSVLAGTVQVFYPVPFTTAGALTSVHYRTPIGSTTDFAAGGIKADAIAESTSAAGITLSNDTTVTTSKALAVTTADKLTVGAVIVPVYKYVLFNAYAAADIIDRNFFIADRAYIVTAVTEVHAIAENTATRKITVTKDTSTTAPGGGTTLLTDNANTGFDTKATANTVQTGTLTGTAGTKTMAAGDRLGVHLSGAITEMRGCLICVQLQAV